MEKEVLQSAISLLLILSVLFLVLGAFCCFGDQMQSISLIILSIMFVVILAVIVFRALW